MRVWEHWRGRIAPVLERRVLVSLLLIAGGLWLFLGLADEIREGEQFRLDRAILLLFREPGNPAEPIGPVWLESAVRDVTALGGTMIITMVTLVTAGYLVISGKRHMALLIAGRDPGRGIAQLRHQGRRRAAAARAVSAWHAGLHGELPKRPCHGVGRHLSHPGRPPGPISAASAAQDLSDVRGGPADPDDRPVAALSRRALAHGRAGRLDPGVLLGATVLDRGAPAPETVRSSHQSPSPSRRRKPHGSRSAGGQRSVETGDTGHSWTLEGQG